MPQLNGIERRFTPSDGIRAETDTNRISGYSAVYNSDSVLLWDFVERIAPGAFSRAIRERQDVRALVDHDASRIIARSTSGTLQLSEDSKGLMAVIDVADTQAGRDILASIRRGDVTGQSFSFRTVKDQWEFRDDGRPDLRTLIDVDLFDVGPVTFPAYPATTADARSMEAMEAVADAHKQARAKWESEHRRRFFQLTRKHRVK